MSAEGHSQNPVIKAVIHDPAHDEAEHDEHNEPHDHATEVAHAWEHFRENNIFFLGGFLPVILLTVIAFNVDFGRWNHLVTWLLAAARSVLIAYFMSRLFKQFSLVFRTFVFSLIFLIGMIFLSLWDSDLVDHYTGRGIGNPIFDSAHPESMHP